MVSRLLWFRNYDCWNKMKKNYKKPWVEDKYRDVLIPKRFALFFFHFYSAIYFWFFFEALIHMTWRVLKMSCGEGRYWRYTAFSKIRLPLLYLRITLSHGWNYRTKCVILTEPTIKSLNLWINILKYSLLTL